MRTVDTSRFLLSVWTGVCRTISGRPFCEIMDTAVPFVACSGRGSRGRSRSRGGGLFSCRSGGSAGRRLGGPAAETGDLGAVGRNAAELADLFAVLGAQPLRTAHTGVGEA